MSSINWFKIIGTPLALGILLLAACSTPTEETPPGQAISGLANVESIDLLMLESFPVQVHVIARGYLPDGCTTIDQVEQTFDATSNTFTVEISTLRPADAICTEAIVEFEETIALEVNGLPAGTYTVDVNGVTGTFTFSVDNTL